MRQLTYVIITPARNEEKFIGHTLRSVTAQTLKPLRWFIVNDGSTDGTARIVERYSRQYPWITLIDSKGSDHPDKRISKIVAAFQTGYERVCDWDWDFIVKLDADLTLPENYFKEVARAFEKNPRVGICGGYIVQYGRNGNLVREKVSERHVRGAFKSYRRECFNDIGGLSFRKSWDSIDQYTAMYLGWRTMTLPLKVIHHRKTGALLDKGLAKSIESGSEYYLEGHGPLLALIRSCRWGMNRSPILVTGIVFLAGYIAALASRKEKYVSKDMERFIRSFQRERILKKLGLKYSHAPSAPLS